ncbi:histidinol-phosphatase HisJ [Gorillibacterium timonense]|uniref:histidinol-phosphatase HisJ n=1 Tax=Gorillibacterium timonense TaxID=1689269 RepID=UPI001F3E5E9D|nr:histidinol-phosphatase HisJ [Gorillibacterium timonense]
MMNTELKWNGHTHTDFCRHGSSAPMEDYIETAMKHGFKRYTLSEHPPLPVGWIPDEPLMRELAMEEHELPAYLDAATGVKQRFADRLEILVGLELDYLEGRTGYSEGILEQTEGRLEDLLVSVHYLRGRGGMRCIDFTPADFRENLLSYYGSIEAVVDAYYDQVEQALEWAASLPGQKRLGHINLIRKFQNALPEMDNEQVKERLSRVVPLLQRTGLGLDINTAGLRVPTCGEVYVPVWLIEKCMASGIPCVFGSDAHKPEDVAAGWDWFEGTIHGMNGK